MGTCVHTIVYYIAYLFYARNIRAESVWY